MKTIWNWLIAPLRRIEIPVLCVLAALSLMSIGLIWSQQGNQSIPAGGSSTTIVTTNPTTCTTGQVFYNSATQQAFYCTATNTFSISNGAALPLTFYGAKGDVRFLTGCSLTINTVALSCTGGTLTQADVGKFIQYGISNGCGFLNTNCSPSITAVANANNATLSSGSTTATITNSNSFILGTDNTAAIRAATVASVAIGLPIEVPAGQYLFGCNATTPIIQPTANFPGMRGAGNSGANGTVNLLDGSTRFIECSSMILANGVGAFFDGINALSGMMLQNLGVDGTISPSNPNQQNGQTTAWFKLYSGQTIQNVVGNGATFTNSGGVGGAGVQLAQIYASTLDSFFQGSNAVGCYASAAQTTFDTTYCGNNNISVYVNGTSSSDPTTGPVNFVNSVSDECGYGSSYGGLTTAGCFQVSNSLSVNITNSWLYCYTGTASTTLYALAIAGTSTVTMANSAAGQYLVTTAGPQGCGGIQVGAGGTLSMTSTKYWSASNRNYINNSGTIYDLGGNACGSAGCGGTYSGTPLSALSGTFNCINVTPVTTSGGSVTTFQNTLSCTIPANTLNMVGKTLSIEYYGLYTTTAANTSTISLKAQLCSVAGCATGNSATLVNVTSAANAGGVSNFAMSYRGKATTQTAGAALAEESHGLYMVDVGATNVLPDTVYSDTNIATVTGSPSAIDSTAQNFLQISCAFSIANAANTCQGRQLVVESIQ